MWKRVSLCCICIAFRLLGAFLESRSLDIGATVLNGRSWQTQTKHVEQRCDNRKIDIMRHKFMLSKFQCASFDTEEEYCVFYNWFATTQQCVLLLTKGPGPINICKKSNRQCTYVQCQPGMGMEVWMYDKTSPERVWLVQPFKVPLKVPSKVSRQNDIMTPWAPVGAKHGI